MDNVEGVQQWKAILLEHVGQKNVVVDLGSGKTTPYKKMLVDALTPKQIYFVDNRMKINHWDGIKCVYVKMDAFTYLEELEDQSIDYLWASEFLEHIPPVLQKKLFELIVVKAKTYCITFPTTKHHDFHKDPTHRPVMLPHLQFLLYGDTAWEGMITNDRNARLVVKVTYPTTYEFRPKKTVSRARFEALGDDAYD